MTQATSSTVDGTLSEIFGGIVAITREVSAPRTHERILGSAGVRVDRAGATLLYKMAMAGDGAPRISTVAELLGVDAATVTRKVHQLESEGLLARHEDPDDKRAVRLSLTEEGQRVVDSVQRARLEWLAQLLTGFTDQEVEQFGRLMSRFAAAIANERHDHETRTCNDD